MKSLFTWLLLVVVSAPLRAQENLGDGLVVHAGAINSVVVERNGHRLAVYGDEFGQSPLASTVLLTHARRDVTWAARGLLQAGGKAIVPARELELFAEPGQFWKQWQDKRFHDYAQQSTKLPIEPIPVARSVQGGDTVEWEGLTFRVLDTPGYTRGAVSYVVDLAGRKIAFTGDLIRDDGKLQDLFSLQDAIPDANIGGYHGWAGRLGDLVASLQTLAAEQPDLLIPARGPVIDDPAAAIERLQARVRAVYANYLSIDALRWYFGDDHIRTKARRVIGPDAQIAWMPMADTAPLPPWLHAISNSRLILSTDGAGFQVDCGGTGIVDELKKMRDAGQLATVEHVFVTHYHDDHTDALPVLVDEFGSQVHACASLIDVLERPGDYRLPCLTKNPVRVTASRRDGESWRWREFRMTIYDFPGQTLHHNALLVERDGGGAVLLAGDSFTPSGIDDYCLPNRNFLGPGRGLLRCLDLVATLPADCWVINQHVEPMFRFSPEQIATMRDTLQDRIALVQDLLLPYDDPNFGLDEGWAVLHPYAVQVRPGDTARLQLRITNHSPRERTFRAVLHAPSGFVVEPILPTSIAAREDGFIIVGVAIPSGASPGLYVLTADVAWEDGALCEWAEGLVEVVP